MYSLYNYINKTHLDKFSIYAIGGAIYYPLKIYMELWDHYVLVLFFMPLAIRPIVFVCHLQYVLPLHFLILDSFFSCQLHFYLNIYGTIMRWYYSFCFFLSAQLSPYSPRNCHVHSHDLFHPFETAATFN
jgi:hypothetical protein